MHPLRFSPPPEIILDPRFYRNIADFEQHFARGAPSLLQCDYLKIDGDIHFGAQVRIEGAVHLRNPTDRPARIADGARIHTPAASI